MKEADFKASYDHLAHSLDNTQGTIRFVDKKIGSAMALLTAVLGFVFPKFVDIETVVEVWQLCGYGKGCVVLLGIVGIACVVLFLKVLHFAAVAMSPRPPSGSWSSHKWLLFPFWNTKAEGNDYDAVTKAKITLNGISRADILAEFREQLCVLGGILAAKINACGKMFRCLWQFFIALMVFVLIVLLFIKLPYAGSDGKGVEFYRERTETLSITI